MSFRAKLTIAILLLTALSFGGGGTAMITASFREARQKEEQNALHDFQDACTMIRLFYLLDGGEGPESISTVMRHLETEELGHWSAVRVEDPEGGIELYREGSAEMPVPEDTWPEAGVCLLKPVEDAQGHGLMLYCGIRMGDVPLHLTARYDMTELYERYDRSAKAYLAVYAAVVAVGGILSVLLSFALTGRLRRLTGTARRIANGELSVRSGLEAGDEFGALSADLDRMADSLEEKIGTLEGELERQEAFVGAFAHELKTPMTSIIGFADIIRQGGADEDTRMMVADYISSEGRRLERLSFKLLDLLLLDRDAIVLRETALSPFLQDTVRLLTPVLRERGVTLSARAGRGRAFLEPDLMRSLLNNLIDNAAKAMDGSGRIDVTAGTLPDGAVFTVKDNGRGMEAEELKHITEAFYRVDKARSRSQGGAGLGLALCRRIAELHNGTLRFESTPGEGTTVTLMIHTKEAGEEQA